MDFRLCRTEYGQEGIATDSDWTEQDWERIRTLRIDFLFNRVHLPSSTNSDFSFFFWFEISSVSAYSRYLRGLNITSVIKFQKLGMYVGEEFSLLSSMFTLHKGWYFTRLILFPVSSAF